METNIKNGTANNNNGSNKICRCLHSYLAMFFLPVAILFAITGVFMCLESRGSEYKTYRSSG
jgi:hypothetical protein